MGDTNLKRRRLAIAGLALLVAGTAARHPTADIQVLTHEAQDLSPHRVQAAVDLGLVGFKVLVTWSAGRLR